jgi:hypothetical protein
MTAEQGRAILWPHNGCDPDDPTTWTQPVIRLGPQPASPGSCRCEFRHGGSGFPFLASECDLEGSSALDVVALFRCWPRRCADAHSRRITSRDPQNAGPGWRARPLAARTGRVRCVGDIRKSTGPRDRRRRNRLSLPPIPRACRTGSSRSAASIHGTAALAASRTSYVDAGRRRVLAGRASHTSCDWR